MRQRVYIMALLAAVAGGLTVPAGETAYSDGIAAIVNDQVITVFEIMRETREAELALRRQLDNDEFTERATAMRQEVAEHLVNRALIYEEYKRNAFELPPKFINERLDEVVVERAGGDWQKFEESLHDNGMSMQEFKEGLEKSLAVEVMLSQLVRRPAHVTPSEVTEYYQGNKDQYREASQVHLRIVAVKNGEKTAAELEAAVRQVNQQLGNGKEFSDVARALSEDTSAERGGDVGWIDTTTGRKEFITAVSPLDPGEITEPIRLPEAVYWIQLVDMKDAVTQPLDSNLKKEIEKNLLDQKRQERYDELVQELRQKYYVKTFF